MDKMFCFQCEQTANNKGCTVQGVCGKSAETANLQDKLTSKIIEFANCTDFSEENISLIIEALFATITNVNFDNNSIKKLSERISQKIQCCNSFDIKSVWECSEDIRSLKSLILFGLKGIAAYAYHAKVLGYKDESVDKFFFEALQDISNDLSIDELLTLVLKTGEVNLKCQMEIHEHYLNLYNQ